MAITVSISFDNLAGVTQTLAGYRERGGDLRPALRSIARAGVASTRRRFLTGTAPDGSPWKKGRKASGQTLIEAGLLLRSIAARPAEAAAVEWGSNRVYAGIHQTGGTIRPKNGKVLRFKVAGGFVSAKSVTLPARPYLGVSAADAEQFGAIALRHIAGDAAGGASA